jgi:hypothetical protein
VQGGLLHVPPQPLLTAPPPSSSRIGSRAPLTAIKMGSLANAATTPAPVKDKDVHPDIVKVVTKTMNFNTWLPQEDDGTLVLKRRLNEDGYLAMSKAWRAGLDAAVGCVMVLCVLQGLSERRDISFLPTSQVRRGKGGGSETSLSALTQPPRPSLLRRL